LELKRLTPELLPSHPGVVLDVLIVQLEYAGAARAIVDAFVAAGLESSKAAKGARGLLQFAPQR
jgi:hypothetical protein